MRKSRFWFILLVISFSDAVQAQHQWLQAELRQFKSKEDSLKKLSITMINGENEGIRQDACNQFIPILVRALKISGSFYYPFDSLQHISIQYPPDSSFRIFTWGLERSLGLYRHYGAIQMRTTDNSLKLFPLFDHSDYSRNAADTIASNNAWVGCIYYKIVERSFGGKKFYTLFGFDGNTRLSNKKWIEVLTFPNGRPLFGAPVFSFMEDPRPRPVLNRFFIEYKKDASARLNYDEELHMILYDHLVSETNEPGKRYTYIPDGDYEGFVWKNGQWVHVDKVFTQQLNDGEFPVPEPLDFKKDGLIQKDTLNRKNRKGVDPE